MSEKQEKKKRYNLRLMTVKDHWCPHKWCPYIGPERSCNDCRAEYMRITERIIKSVDTVIPEGDGA